MNRKVRINLWKSTFRENSKNGWFDLVFYLQNFRRASQNYVRLRVQSQINSLFWYINQEYKSLGVRVMSLQSEGSIFLKPIVISFRKFRNSWEIFPALFVNKADQ